MGAEDGLSGGENDPIYKTIEEKTGVKLVPQNVTWDDADQKIQLWRQTASFRISLPGIS